MNVYELIATKLGLTRIRQIDELPSKSHSTLKILNSLSLNFDEDIFDTTIIQYMSLIMLIWTMLNDINNYEDNALGTELKKKSCS